MEDFGWNGDEFLIGDCQDDWASDLLDLAGDEYEEHMEALREDMDGDAESALASCGWGTDEDYGYFGEDE